MTSIISNVDSYKLCHYLVYPPKTEYVSSYIEARGVSTDFPETSEIVSLGVQGFVRANMYTPITCNDIRMAKDFARQHGLPFNETDWKIILDEYGGYLPLKIEAIPDGTVVPVGTCQVQVVNTDKRLPWLTSYVETALLRAIWYPSTVATLSREVKKVCKQFLEETADTLDALDYMLHDFGARGASSQETAAIGAHAHLVSFMGSDTFDAIEYIRNVYYPGSLKGWAVPSKSIPAAEHSTITSWVANGGEKAAFKAMIDNFAGPGKIYAVVSDSYDIYHAVDKLWGEELKEEVLNKGGTVVIRPDSGDPGFVVPRILGILETKFGVSYNQKGYKALHPSVRVIQGDGMSPHSIERLLSNLKALGWSAENIVFGMGGALLQKVNRDSLKYAMKASAICINGQWHDVFKDPVTDTGKKSKRGRLAVESKDLRTVRQEDVNENALRPVWDMTEGLTNHIFDSFETVKKRAAI